MTMTTKGNDDPILNDVKSQIMIVEKFQEDIYGDIEKLGNQFPLSLRENEAGASNVLTPDSSHSIRRYLWTDAFGILNYVSLAMAYRDMEQRENYEKNLACADALIHSVFAVLGNPANVQCPMTLSLSPAGGYKGLRIGKLKCRAGSSDAGMEYDGMYFHYIDKFLFALCRYSRCLEPTHKAAIITKAVQLVKDIHPHFLVPGAGYMWKVNTDMSPIPSVQTCTTNPSHDTVTAFVIYKIIEAEGGDVSAELSDLFPLVMTYFESQLSDLMKGAYDALGLGCHLWILQFVEPIEVTVTTDQEAISTTQDQYSVSISQYPVVIRNLSRYAEELKRLAKQILQEESNQLEIPQSNPLYFRVYGGILGAQLISMTELPPLSPNLYMFARKKTEHFVHKQLHKMHRHGQHYIKGSLHSINLTMLSACVLPLSWKRLPHERFFKAFLHRP